MVTPHPATILLVDDQREARQMLRAALESLGSRVRVIEVPSGEEALLLFRRSPIDLLIVDIRLAGMTGFELLSQIRRHIPDLKVIVVTGMPDEKIRQEINAAQVEAFFYKPIVVTEFLSKIEDLLGLLGAGNSPPDAAEAAVDQVRQTQDSQPGPVSLVDVLVKLQQQLEAISVALIDETGRIMARAGEIVDQNLETNILPAVMTILSAGAKIAYYLEHSQADDLYYIRGDAYQLYLAHVGEQLALLVLIQPDGGDEELRVQNLRNIRLAVVELARDLPRTAIPATKEPELEFDQVPGELDTEAMSELDQFFSQTAKQNLDAGEVDRFWETAAAESTGKGFVRPDALTFEQARKLGLTPEEE